MMEYCDNINIGCKKFALIVVLSMIINILMIYLVETII